jgi:type IV fimbrial biogenesis protein FimT
MRKSAGFTMMELLMVMLIAGILAAIGTSSFKYVATSNRISTEINGLLGDMQFARSQAIKSGSPVTVCPSVAPNYTTCAGSATWTSGWIVFLDFNGNGLLDAGDRIIRTQKTIAPDVLTGSANFNYIVFNREGFGSNTLLGWTSLSLNSNPVNPQWRRCLAVSAVGALTIEKGGDLIPLTC